MSDKADFWAEYFKQPSLDKETIEFNKQLDKGIQEMFDDSELLNKETIEFDQWLEKEIQKMFDDSGLLDKETIEFDQWLEKEIQKKLFNTESEDNEHE